MSAASGPPVTHSMTSMSGRSAPASGVPGSTSRVASSIDGTSSLTGRTAAGAPWSMPRISARKYADVRITPNAAITASTVYVGAGSPGHG